MFGDMAIYAKTRKRTFELVNRGSGSLDMKERQIVKYASSYLQEYTRHIASFLWVGQHSHVIVDVVPRLVGR